MDLSQIDFGQLAPLLAQATADKNWFLLVAVLLVGAVLAVRKFLAPRVPFFATQEGGALLNLGLAFGGALLTAAVGGQPFSGDLFISAGKVALTAAGGWTLIKHLMQGAWPIIQAAAKRMFQGKVDAPKLLAEAKAEGIKAGEASKAQSAADEIKRIIPPMVLLFALWLPSQASAQAAAEAPVAEDETITMPDDRPIMLEVEHGELIGSVQGEKRTVRVGPGLFLNAPAVQKTGSHMGEVSAENVALKAENERLKADLQQIAASPPVNVPALVVAIICSAVATAALTTGITLIAVNSAAGAH